jgi:hypothetical protein
MRSFIDWGAKILLGEPKADALAPCGDEAVSREQWSLRIARGSVRENVEAKAAEAPFGFDDAEWGARGRVAHELHARAVEADSRESDGCADVRVLRVIARGLTSGTVEEHGALTRRVPGQQAFGRRTVPRRRWLDRGVAHALQTGCPRREEAVDAGYGAGRNPKRRGQPVWSA